MPTSYSRRSVKLVVQDAGKMFTGTHRETSWGTLNRCRFAFGLDLAITVSRARLVVLHILCNFGVAVTHSFINFAKHSFEVSDQPV